MTAIFDTVTLNGWSDIQELEVGWGMSVFRGQANSAWEPEISLRRAFFRERSRFPEKYHTHADESDFEFNEYALFREFRRRAHQYVSDLPEPDDFVGWLALMQHHGTPTRLLDFTYSFYIAVFFAICDSTADAAVWAVDEQFILHSGCSIAGADGVSNEDRLAIQHEYANTYLQGSFGQAKYSPSWTEAKTGVVVLEPEHLRLGIQQGVMLMPLDTRRPFLENLLSNVSDNGYGRGVITKYILPLEFRESLMANLHKMNITAETLFPGIDGYARSIEHKIWSR